MYFLNSTKHYQLAQSVLRREDKLLDVDIELPDTQWLDELRFSTEWIQNDQLTISKEMKLRGKRYVMSVRCINKNAILDQYGSEIDMVEYDGTILKECRGYLVQGLPWNAFSQTLHSAYAWQASA